MIGITEQQMVKRLRAEKKKLQNEIESVWAKFALGLGTTFIIGIFLGRVIR